MQNDGALGTPPAIEVDLRPVDAPTFAAAVRLHGEHDLTTADPLRESLAPLYGDVLIDLSACEFIDSAVIGVLLADSDTRRREGQRLELLVPADNRVIMRTIQVSGVARLLLVRTEPEASTHEAQEGA